MWIKLDPFRPEILLSVNVNVMVQVLRLDKQAHDEYG